MRRKPAILLALIALFLGAAEAAAQQQMPVPAPPQLGATSYILMDHHSGRELVAEKADQRMEPASLTKMMTAYVVFSELEAGHISLDETVRVSEKAWRMQGSKMFIEVGEQVTIEELLRGMIVQSGNDASVALAEHVAGDETTFAQVMNQYAEQLGMTGTQYANATGWPDPNQYTTARDTAILASAIIRDFPKYYDYYSEQEYTFNGITQRNRNELLGRDPSVDGLKTGHTESAGYCLAASAQRDDMRLISVVMDTDSEAARADQSQALLNYGFRFFETHKLYSAGDTLTQTRVWKGSSETLPLGLQQDLYVTIPKRHYDDLDATMNVQQLIMAPVSKGSRLGSVAVALEDRSLAEAPLVALQDVEEGSLWQRMVDQVLLMFE